MAVVNKYLGMREDLSAETGKDASKSAADALDLALSEALQSASEVIFSVGFGVVKKLDQADTFSLAVDTFLGNCKGILTQCIEMRGRSSDGDVPTRAESKDELRQDDCEVDQFDLRGL
eukprot:728655-Hanusia_phi.AAC.1